MTNYVSLDFFSIGAFKVFAYKVFYLNFFSFTEANAFLACPKLEIKYLQNYDTGWKNIGVLEGQCRQTFLYKGSNLRQVSVCSSFCEAVYRRSKRKKKGVALVQQQRI